MAIDELYRDPLRLNAASEFPFPEELIATQAYEGLRRELHIKKH